MDKYGSGSCPCQIIGSGCYIAKKKDSYPNLDKHDKTSLKNADPDPAKKQEIKRIFRPKLKRIRTRNTVFCAIKFLRKPCQPGPATGANFRISPGGGGIIGYEKDVKFNLEIHEYANSTNNY